MSCAYPAPRFPRQSESYCTCEDGDYLARGLAGDPLLAPDPAKCRWAHLARRVLIDVLMQTGSDLT